MGLVTVLGFLMSAAASRWPESAWHATATRSPLARVSAGSGSDRCSSPSRHSLPELVADVAAVRLEAPDIAAGDLFGSNMANMLILALVSLVPGTDLFRGAALDNALSASLAIALAAVRLRAYDLAVGNLFGSNALSMAMFLPLDVADGAGPILAGVHRFMRSPASSPWC
jgi:hypothetical protein